MNTTRAGLNLYARLQSRVSNHGSVELMTQDWEKGGGAQMCDVLGQTWTLPGLIGRHWTVGTSPQDTDVMEAALALDPNALKDTHTLAWVVAGTFKPSQWMDEKIQVWFDDSRQQPWSKADYENLCEWRRKLGKIMAALAPDLRVQVERQASHHLLQAVQLDMDNSELTQSTQRWLNAATRWLVDMTQPLDRHLPPSMWDQPYPSSLAQAAAHSLVTQLFLMERTGVYSYSIVEALTPIPPTDWNLAQGSIALRQAWIDVALGCLGSPVAAPNAGIGGEAPAGALRALWGIKAVSLLMRDAPAEEVLGLYDALEPILPALRTQLRLLQSDWDNVVPFGDRPEALALKDAFLTNIDVQLRAARLDAALPSMATTPRLRM